MVEKKHIKKKHYSAAVMTEFKRRDAARENNEKRISKIEEDIESEYNSYINSMGLLDSDE